MHGILQAFRWGKLAFEAKNENGTSDPLCLDAFEKCSFGLLSTASKLVDRCDVRCIFVIFLSRK